METDAVQDVAQDWQCIETLAAYEAAKIAASLEAEGYRVLSMMNRPGMFSPCADDPALPNT